jgi:RNA polymerase sigma factor (sigma-70 family)
MKHRQSAATGPRTGAGPKKDDFSAVYDRHFTTVYRFVYYKTFHRERAEDLTSHAFLKAYEKYHTFDPVKGQVLAWLLRIAGNAVADDYRKHRRNKSIHDVWDIAGTEDVPLDLENRERLFALQRAVAALSAAERDVLMLRIWENIPYRTIASLLNKSEAGCKMLFSRTLGKLRGSLGAMTLLALFGAPGTFMSGGRA